MNKLFRYPFLILLLMMTIIGMNASCQNNDASKNISDSKNTNKPISRGKFKGCYVYVNRQPKGHKEI